MKKRIITTIFLICAFGLKAQSLKNSDFKKTEWFADNKNQNFYTSDTISLTQLLQLNSENKKLNETYIKLQQNNNRDITELNFKSNGILTVENFNVENWDVSKIIGKWKWKFNSKNQILNLYFNNKMRHSFRIDSKKNDSLIWKSEQDNKKSESKVDLLILKLIRIKK
jgi:hypothetical protein